MKRALLVAAVPSYLLLLACLTVPFIQAGMPNSCPVPGHGGPPCNMEKCKAMDKDGKKTGSNCSKYCAKSCCLCSDACPKEQNQNSPTDEEQLAYQFGG